MNEFSLHVLLLACASLLLLSVSVASATAQYLRCNHPNACTVAVDRSPHR